jgi:hypothetical protein
LPLLVVPIQVLLLVPLVVILLPLVRGRTLPPRGALITPVPAAMVLLDWLSSSFSSPPC